MHINLECVMYVGRGYAEAGGFEAREPYDLVFSVFKVAEGVARVFAAHGELPREAFRQICAELAGKGFHTALVERHGVERALPTGLTPPTGTERHE